MSSRPSIPPEAIPTTYFAYRNEMTATIASKTSDVSSVLPVSWTRSISTCFQRSVMILAEKKMSKAAMMTEKTGIAHFSRVISLPRAL